MNGNCVPVVMSVPLSTTNGRRLRAITSAYVPPPNTSRL
jgi:hypothetical protein